MFTVKKCRNTWMCFSPMTCHRLPPCWQPELCDPTDSHRRESMCVRVFKTNDFHFSMCLRKPDAHVCCLWRLTGRCRGVIVTCRLSGILCENKQVDEVSTLIWNLFTPNWEDSHSNLDVCAVIFAFCLLCLCNRHTLRVFVACERSQYVLSAVS